MLMVKRTRHNRTATTERGNYYNYKRFCLLFYFLGDKSNPLLDSGVGYKLILVNYYGLIVQEKSSFR